MPPLPRLALSKIEIAFGVLALVSISLIFLPKNWISQSYTFTPQQYTPSIYGDRYSGGNSDANWVDRPTHTWRCDLGNRHPTPFCSIQYIVLNDTWTGLDLRQFSKMTVYGQYQGNGEHLRIYLRNRHSDYYQIGEETSTKYNMVELPVNNLAAGITVQMKDFTVADWWVAQFNIPLDRSHPEFNDVIIIEAQTGSRSKSGSHNIQIQKIVWSGSILSDEQLYKYLAIMWSCLIFVYLFYRLASLKFAIEKHKNHQKELLSINNMLDLKSKEYEELAKRDQLTGLYNRVGIKEVLYDSAQQWKKHHTPLSFVLIDIDHFKKVNDSHGHDVGDAILKGAASTLQANIRQTDYLARWGGEEFLLVCPNTTIHQAASAAESLRAKLEASTIYEGIKVTASFGVATMTEPGLEHLFKAADLALYDAKENGRNKVCMKN